MAQISPEQLEKAKKTVENNPRIIGYFGEEWINEHLTIADRGSKHPIFWILVDEPRCSKILKNLNVLKEKCNKFQKLIDKLKSGYDELNFHAILTEVEVLAYYYQKESDKFIIEYEPSGTKGPDCKISIEGVDYYLEILNIFLNEKINAEKGFVGSLNPGIRIKNKVLDKAKQLPNNEKNIVVVNCSYAIEGDIGLQMAFVGQPKVNNGIIHHPAGKNISLMVGYKGEFHSKWFYPTTREWRSGTHYEFNPYANQLIDEKFAKMHF